MNFMAVKVAVVGMCILSVLFSTGCDRTFSKPTQSDDTFEPTPYHLQKLLRDGIAVDEEQSFATNIDDFGPVYFISGYYQDGDGIDKAAFFFASSENNWIYEFPEYYGNALQNNLYAISDVKILDIDKDGKKDVLIISEYIFGAGAQGAVPQSVAAVYFRRGDEFENDDRFNADLNNYRGEYTAENILDYIDEHPGKPPREIRYGELSFEITGYHLISTEVAGDGVKVECAMDAGGGLPEPRRMSLLIRDMDTNEFPDIENICDHFTDPPD
jgi:hypothetical protein